jgi:predicted phage gp36 major capsid-like protein
MTEKEAKRRTKMIEKTSLWIRDEFAKTFSELEKETNKKKRQELHKKLDYLKVKANSEIKEIDRLFKQLGYRDDYSDLDSPEF